MKTTQEIKDEVYAIIKGSTLMSNIDGVLRKTKRPGNSTKTDILISVHATPNRQRQEAIVYVSIFVPHILRDNQLEDDTPKLRTLEQLSSELLDTIKYENVLISLDEQSTFEAPTGTESIIKNKLFYKILNLHNYGRVRNG